MMKNSSKILFTILILSICGAIVFPFWLYIDIKEAINISGYLMGTIVNVVTIVIAFLLFDRFGVSKKTLDKNVETVFKLLEVIKSKIIYTEYESESGIYHSAILISDNLDEYKKNEIMLNKVILFNYEDINNGLDEINQFSTNIWLPVHIREKIQKLSLVSASAIKDISILKNNCVKIYFHLYPEERKEKDILWYMTNQKETTFIEFLSNLEDLVFDIKTWLNKHSNNNLELNI
jgi:hypothetical protein